MARWEDSAIGKPLPEEDPTLDDPVELQHWIALYEVRGQIWRRRLQGVRDDPGRRAELRRHLAWVEERAAYWRHRHAEVAGVAVNTRTREMIGHRGRVRLTRRELELLRQLVDHPGEYVPADRLLSQAWPDSRLRKEQLRTYIGRLRRKMAEAGAPCHILARRPHGYALVTEGGASNRNGLSRAS